MIINEREIHQKTIAKYGERKMINKTIQECTEYMQALNDYKNGLPDALADVLEEGEDVVNMKRKMDIMFDFHKPTQEAMRRFKMRRTIDMLEPDNDYTLAID